MQGALLGITGPQPATDARGSGSAALNGVELRPFRLSFDDHHDTSAAPSPSEVQASLLVGNGFRDTLGPSGNETACAAYGTVIREYSGQRYNREVMRAALA